MRTLAIEYLVHCPFENAIEKLVGLAQEKNADDREDVSIQIRIAAIKSLAVLNSAAATSILEHILTKKRFFFFPLEPTDLRLFAQEQLNSME